MGKWILIIVALTTVSARPATPRMEVVAHISYVDASEFEIVAAAKARATDLLEEAGVRLRWSTHCKNCEFIEIRMDSKAPSNLGKEALAYSLPYAQGTATRIHIFRDRVCYRPRALVRADIVLGYVLAHEIVHVLDQLDHHSDSGVMKARWDYQDFLAMQQSRLSFCREDLERIRLDLALVASKSK